jgi:hypothetical protein
MISITEGCLKLLGLGLIALIVLSLLLGSFLPETLG